MAYIFRKQAAKNVGKIMLNKSNRKSIAFKYKELYESSPEVLKETYMFPVLRAFYTKPFRFPVPVKPFMYSPVEFRLRASNEIGDEISESETVEIAALEVQVCIYTYIIVDSFFINNTTFYNSNTHGCKRLVRIIEVSNYRE